jgi:hypothetical protein
VSIFSLITTILNIGIAGEYNKYLENDEEDAPMLRCFKREIKLIAGFLAGTLLTIKEAFFGTISSSST